MNHPLGLSLIVAEGSSGSVGSADTQRTDDRQNQTSFQFTATEPFHSSSWFRSCECYSAAFGLCLRRTEVKPGDYFN